MRNAKRQRVAATTFPKSSASQPPDAYALPPAIVAVDSEPEPVGEPWNPRALIFKCWPVSVGGERDALLCDVLESRGWIDGGMLCNPNDVTELPSVLASKDPKRPLPRRALWIPTDANEVKVLHNAFSVDARLAQRFRVAGLPCSGLACFKTYTAKALAGQPFVPLTYVLPAQREE